MREEPSLSEAKRRLLELQRRGKFATADLSSHIPSATQTRAGDSLVALAPAQEEVWRLDQIAGKIAPLHNESITIHREGPCDAVVMERALLEIIRRHEIWRTTFETRNGSPVQVVHETPAGFRLAVSDLRVLPEGERNAKALELATADARQSFDLERGPLLQARLVTLEDWRHRLYLTAHQCIVDGITVFDVFPSELTTLYESFAAGRPSPLPELEAQYADFADWQRRKLAGPDMQRQLEYWKKELAGDMSALRWPGNGDRPTQQTYRGAMYSFELTPELTQSLKELGRREGATLFMILLAGLVSLLHRYTGQENIIVGTLAPAGRKQIDFQRCMGYFLNPVALRANLANKPSFDALVRQTRDVVLGAISHDDIPIGALAEQLKVNPDPSRHTLFTVALSVAPDVAQLPSGWSMTYMDVESGGARWDLYLEFSDRPEALLGRAQYNPDLFTGEEIGRTVEDLQLLLEEIVRDRAYTPAPGNAETEALRRQHRGTTLRRGE